MVSTASSIRSRENEPSPPEDWPAQMAESIERVVGSVRDKTTGPALKAARVVVYGTFLALVAVPTLVVFVVLLLRVTNIALPDSVFGERHMWAAHLLWGIVFSLLGMICWRRRQPRLAEQMHHH